MSVSSRVIVISRSGGARMSQSTVPSSPAAQQARGPRRSRGSAHLCVGMALSLLLMLGMAVVLALALVSMAGLNHREGSSAGPIRESLQGGAGKSVTVVTTAYCITGHTASGTWTRHGTIAARLPFGTRIWVPGYGR